MGVRVMKSIDAIITAVLAACFIGLSGCDDGDSASYDRFSVEMNLPSEPLPLDRGAIGPLLYAVQTQGFETEYGTSDALPPHEVAWSREDVRHYALNDAPRYELLNCQDIAENQGLAGKGTLEIFNTVTSNYLGSLEYIFDGCVIGPQAFSGTRKVSVYEGVVSNSFSNIPAKFSIEYENYYWGTDGLNYSLDGTVVYEQSGSDSVHPPYKSTSNYTFGSRHYGGYTMDGLESVCEYSYRVLEWACNIESGTVGLSDYGEYQVESVGPIYSTLWSNE